MTVSAPRAAVEERWRTNWTANAVTLRTPTTFGNSRTWLTRVDGTLSLTAPPNATEWARVTVTLGARDAAAINPFPLMRSQGLIDVQLFTPKGKGLGALDTLVDLAVPIFERQEFGDLTVQSVRVGETAEPPPSEWVGRLLRFAFLFQEFSPVA